MDVLVDSTDVELNNSASSLVVDGRLSRVRDEHVERVGGETMPSLYGAFGVFRGIFRRRLFSFVSILVFGVALGVCMAVLSLLHAAMFNDLPYSDADRVAVITGDTSFVSL